MILFIDTHNSQHFCVGSTDNAQNFSFLKDKDASSDLISCIEKLTHGLIKEIIIIKGPGSLTGLRIGSSLALGIALGKNIPMRALSIWDILLQEYDADIFFYTGTRKWIKKTKTSQEIITDNFYSNKNWISNNCDKLNKHHLDIKNNIPYPNIIELMPKYMHLASFDVDLLYPVITFGVC